MDLTGLAVNVCLQANGICIRKKPIGPIMHAIMKLLVI